MNWQHLLLGFSGRTPKRDFWIGFGVLVVAGIFANLLPLIGTVASLALIYPWTALMAKRLHDFGRSGWLVVVPAAPAVLSGALALYTALALSSPAAVTAGFAAAGAAVLMSTLAMLVGIGFLLWVGTRDGDAGGNAYGMPLARPAS